MKRKLLIALLIIIGILSCTRKSIQTKTEVTQEEKSLTTKTSFLTSFIDTTKNENLEITFTRYEFNEPFNLSSYENTIEQILEYNSVVNPSHPP